MADCATTGGIKKPNLRNFNYMGNKKSVILSLIATAASGLAFKIFYIDVKVQQSLDFYENYDADAAFDRMHKRGALGMWEDEAEKK